MIIKVTSIEEKIDKSNNSYKHIKDENSQGYYAFPDRLKDKADLDNIKAGTYLEIEVEMSGKYRHLVSAKPASAPAIESHKKESSDREGIITRLACLKCASMIYAARIQQGEQFNSVDLFSIAGVMEQWAKGGSPQNEQKELATEAQRTKIFASIKERGYKNDDITAYMVVSYKTGSTKDLTKSQASELIEAIQGEKIPRKEAVE